MILYENDLWLSDIDTIIRSMPELKELDGRSVMITGAAGLICSSVVDILVRLNESYGYNIHILAAGRWLKEMTDRFGYICDRPYFEFVYYDASKPNPELSANADYIIHGASNAFSGLIMKEPVETMLSNFTGLYELLTLAKQNGIKRVLYISSSEVYGNKENSLPFKEDEYGYIDLLNARNSYSVGKRAAETLCASFYDEYGVDSVIVRPGHIYGPTASPYDNRVSSSFAYAAAKGEDITLKSDGSQIRSYCYCLDCASAILKVMLNGESVHAYNISNKESIISISEMSEILAKAGKVRIIYDLPSEEESKAFNPMTNSSLYSEELERLGWHGVFDAQTGFEHTVSILKLMI